ncbi:MAG: hypothetical protein ABJF01_25130 [bacterium]
MTRHSMLSAAVGVVLFAGVLNGCDDAPTIAGGTQCLATVNFSPTSANMAVGDSVRIAISVDGGCPAPIVRDETPAVLQVDVLSTGVFRVQGLSAGAGRVRILSAVDTTVSGVFTASVTAR